MMSAFCGGASPYRYRLNSLTSNGGYFETDVNSADDIGVYCVNATFPHPTTSNRALFGVFGSANRYGVFSSTGSTSFVWWNGALASKIVSVTNSNVKLNFLNSRAANIDDVTWAITATYNASNTNIRLFAAKRMDNGENIFPVSNGCSMGDVYISKGTEVIRHYIPCVSNDGTVEYYEEFTKSFCQRVGDFTEGE